MQHTLNNVFKALVIEEIVVPEDKVAVAVLEYIEKKYTLIPKADESPRARSFHNLKFGYFSKSMTEAEIEIYENLWAGTISDWKNKTDEPMGPFEFIIVDNLIFLYLKVLRIAGDSGKVDIAVGGEAWIADQLLQKQMKLVELFWPRKRALPKPKKKADNAEAETELESTTETIFIFDGKRMNKDEYDEWYNSLTEDGRADKLGRVKTEVVETQTGKKASS